MFGYSGEGWGLTHNQREFILSDGTDTLRSIDPVPLRETRRVTVRAGKIPVQDLNELEYVRGEIYANIWHTDQESPGLHRNRDKSLDGST